MMDKPANSSEKNIKDGPIRVIVADDDEHLLKILARDFDGKGYEYVTESDGTAQCG